MSTGGVVVAVLGVGVLGAGAYFLLRRQQAPNAPGMLPSSVQVTASSGVQPPPKTGANEYDLGVAIAGAAGSIFSTWLATPSKESPQQQVKNTAGLAAAAM